MADYNLAATKIISKQQEIMGPLAVELAQKVQGLRFISDSEVQISEGNPKDVLDNLVLSFERIFGKASVIVSKEAISELRPKIDASDLPPRLVN